LRELDEFLLEAPEAFKPPLQLVRKDLLKVDDILLRRLFPAHHKANQESTPPTGPPKPGAQP
jgi:hypothetical protein